MHDLSKLLKNARTFYAAGDLKQAKFHFKKVLKQKPKNAEALHMNGIIEFQLGQYKKAISSIKNALKIDTQNFDMCNNLGLILQTIGDIQKAEYYYKRAIVLNNLLPQAHYNLGNLQKDQQHYHEAIVSYQNAIKINKDYIDAYTNMSQTYNFIYEYQNAKKYASHAISLNPSFFIAYQNLGNAEFGLGNNDPAIKAYKQCIDLNEQNFEAHCNLAIAYSRISNINEAKVHFVKSINLAPNHINAYVGLANLFSEIGEISQGNEIYQAGATKILENKINDNDNDLIYFCENREIHKVILQYPSIDTSVFIQALLQIFLNKIIYFYDKSQIEKGNNLVYFLLQKIPIHKIQNDILKTYIQHNPDTNSISSKENVCLDHLIRSIFFFSSKEFNKANLYADHFFSTLDVFKDPSIFHKLLRTCISTLQNKAEAKDRLSSFLSSFTGDK